MYTPFFTITPKISKNLESLGAVFGYLNAVQIPEAYKKELVSKVTAETVHSSTAIEGNTLTEKQVEEVLKGKKVMAEGEDIQEVINYNAALEYVQKLVMNNEVIINEKLIREINAIILKNIRDDIAGKYRKVQVIVGDYIPPEPFKVPSLVQELVDWIQNPQPSELSPILCTGIVHYQLVAIHPFEDGNGRTTRVVTTLMLADHGYDMTNYFALESYYNRDRRAYYRALNTADQFRTNGLPDLTQWLEYYVEGILIEAARARSHIEEILTKSKVTAEKVWISTAQMNILKLTYEKETAKIADYLKISVLSRKGTYNAAVKLVQLGLLKRLGQRKGTYYTVTEKALSYIKEIL